MVEEVTEKDQNYGKFGGSIQETQARVWTNHFQAGLEAEDR